MTHSTWLGNVVVIAAVIASLLGASSASADSASSDDLAARAATVPTDDVRVPVRVSVPIVLSAQGTASRVETLLTTWTGLRVGARVPMGQGPWFWGGDGQLLLGSDGNGTVDVGVSRTSVALEGRGQLGTSMSAGLFQCAVWGWAGVGAGVNATDTFVFSQHSTRFGGSHFERVGVGVGPQLGPVGLDVELGMGARDLRFEMSGSVALTVGF